MCIWPVCIIFGLATCGGQLVDNSVFHPFRTSRVPIQRSRWGVRLGWPGGKYEAGTWYRVHAIANISE